MNYHGIGGSRLTTGFKAARGKLLGCRESHGSLPTRIESKITKEEEDGTSLNQEKGGKAIPWIERREGAGTRSVDLGLLAWDLQGRPGALAAATTSTAAAAGGKKGAVLGVSPHLVDAAIQRV